MANIKYFADLDRETVELAKVYGLDKAKFAARFPGVKGRRLDSFDMLVGHDANGAVLPVTRAIEYKRFAIKHVCDARCTNATGKVMKCECACGGKNHGRGDSRVVTFACEAA